MKPFLAIFVLSTFYIVGLSYFGFWDNIAQTTKEIRQSDVKNYHLEQKLVQMKIENNSLKAEIDKLKAKNQYLKLNHSPKTSQVTKNNFRSIASVSMNSGQEDFVQYDVYQWKPEKLLAIAEKELFFKNFEKAAQFYNTFLQKFPHHEMINDEVLFKAGYASYETKHYYQQSIQHFNHLIKSHPRSKLYRSAKLWLGLSYLNSGNESKFIATVEEFKNKYRNTSEWKILSQHYEEIAYKYKDRRR
jgi:tetratricopeptide (TPR) repeat protein